jgi:hypothetical protein
VTIAGEHRCTCAACRSRLASKGHYAARFRSLFTARSLAHNRGRTDRSGDDPHAGESARGDDPLEFAWHGARRRPVGQHGAAHLTRLRVEAASAGDIQALHRSRLRCEGARYGGAVSFPSRACRGALRWRKIPDTGARSQPSGFSNAAQPRLLSARHNIAVRGA